MDERVKPGGLAGLRVLSLESRRAQEMSKLIENYGGRAIVAPSMREVPLESNTEALNFARTLAASGFEMVIFSFGSGLDMEDVSLANIAKYKAFADYAHSKGLQVGGYSLLASRHISEEDDVVNPKTGKRRNLGTFKSRAAAELTKAVVISRASRPTIA